MAPRLGENWQAKLAELKEDWDSYGAKPVTSQAILALESFSTVPDVEGGIELVAFRAGMELSISIRADGSFGHIMVRKADEAEST